jgi:hypothetical protein
MTSGGLGQPSTAATLALNGVPGKILETEYTAAVAACARRVQRRILRSLESAHGRGTCLAVFVPDHSGGGVMEARPRLSLEVELMSEPCLWRWEIRDPERGEVVESSWTREWMAYESPEEAERAGRQRLRLLVRR